MGKNIIILNGSPRRNGNTSALVEKFTQGARKAGQTVSEVFLGDMNIHGCKGCLSGHSSRPCPCVQKDDMDRIYPAMRTCDVVVLASPLYYWNFSGQLRTAMDLTADSKVEIFAEDGAIVMRKYLPRNACAFCGAVAQDAIPFEGRCICPSCWARIAALHPQGEEEKPQV